MSVESDNRTAEGGSPPLVSEEMTRYDYSMENDSIRCKLGPREKGRKHKGKVKPHALRQAKARRAALIQKLSAK